MSISRAVNYTPDTDPLRTEIEVAQTLAREAGRLILRYYSGEEQVNIAYKDEAQSDPVTSADQSANDLIVQGLKNAFPNDAILAEETAENAADTTDRQHNARLWCVDPLDGTREFIDRNGMFVVMIGLAIDGRARAGVVYQPTTDTLYWGTPHGAGMQANNAHTPLHVPTTVPDDPLNIMVSRSHRSGRISRIATALGNAKEIRMGSVGLKVAHVAECKAQLYVSLTDRTKEWDACAPEAIIAGAGGMMTDLEGMPLTYNKSLPNTPKGMVATYGPNHQRVIDAIAAELSD